MLSASILAEPALVVSAAAQDRTGDTEDVSTAIKIGEPVSLRIRLAVIGETDSPKTLPLDGRYAPLQIRVVKPDGTECDVVWKARSGVAHGAGKARVMRAGSLSLLDTFVFERRDSGEDGRPEWRYVFDTPGTYQVSVSYHVGEATVDGANEICRQIP